MIFNETKRSSLPDSSFGIPEDRKFPLDTKEHVNSAIKLFGHAEESKKSALAKRIKAAADKYGIEISNTTQVYKYLKESNIEYGDCNVLINQCIDIIDKLSINEWSMAAFNPIPTINKPYILKASNDSGSLIDAKKYGLAQDIIADKYLIINEDSHLEIVDSSYFNEYNVEVYEYIGNKSNVGKIAKAYKNQDIVDESFFYYTLTNKPLLSEDQIDFDESFVKIDFDLMNEKLLSIKESIKEQWNQVNNKSYSLPVFESFIRNDANLNLNEYMSLREDANGYYVYDNQKHTRTRSVNRISDITDAMIKSIAVI